MKTLDDQLEAIVKATCTRKYGDWENKPESVKIMLYSDTRLTLVHAWAELMDLANRIVMNKETEVGTEVIDFGKIMHGNEDLVSEHAYLK